MTQSTPTSEAEVITTAKSLLRNGAFAEAETLLAPAIEAGSAKAADLLGIAHEIGSGTPKNLALATDYYRVARDRGNALGTYHYGLALYKQSAFAEAFAVLATIAEVNPSAAYWAFRCALILPDMGENSAEATRYLTLAARTGHLGARVKIARQYLRGQNGRLKAPLGYLLIARAFLSGLRALKRGDKQRLY